MSWPESQEFEDKACLRAAYIVLERNQGRCIRKPHKIAQLFRQEKLLLALAGSDTVSLMPL